MTTSDIQDLDIGVASGENVHYYARPTDEYTQAAPSSPTDTKLPPERATPQTCKNGLVN